MERSFQTLTAVLSEDGEVGNEKLLWIVLDKVNHEAQEAGQGGRAEPGHSSRSGCRLLQSWKKIHASAGHKGSPD